MLCNAEMSILKIQKNAEKCRKIKKKINRPASLFRQVVTPGHTAFIP
jgi:hypothetical protein